MPWGGILMCILSSTWPYILIPCILFTTLMTNEAFICQPGNSIPVLWWLYAIGTMNLTLKMHGISLYMYTVWLEKSSKIFSSSTWNFKRSTYFQWIQSPILSSSVSRLLYMYLYVVFLHITLINLASFSDRSRGAGSIMSISCYSHCVNINQVVKCCHEQWSIASAVVLC